MEQQKFVRKNIAVLDAQRRAEKKRMRRTVFYVLLFVLVSLIFLAVCVFVFLKVKNVDIEGATKYSTEQIMELVPISTGDNIYSFDSDDIESKICEAMPYVREVEIKRDLPTTVKINITEEKAVYAATIANDTYILSSELKVLERLPDGKSPPKGLKNISLSNVRRCLVGTQIEFVDKRTLDAVIALYKNCEDNYIEKKIKSVDVRSRFDMYINYDNRFDVYLGDIENIDIKIEFLIGIIEELDPNAKGTIDVSNHQEASVALS